jgi:membrane protein implicated in regulation of membrane protease activity
MDLSLPQIWLIVGLVMLVAELLSVMLVFVFFVMGAFVTAALAATGVLPTVESQILVFSSISLISLLIFRKHARRLLDNRDKSFEYQEFIGETAMVIRDIPMSGEGKIYYRGAEWKAISLHGSVICAGSKVVITRVEGIVLVVEES